MQLFIGRNNALTREEFITYAMKENAVIGTVTDSEEPADPTEETERLVASASRILRLEKVDVTKKVLIVEFYHTLEIHLCAEVSRNDVIYTHDLPKDYANATLYFYSSDAVINMEKRLRESTQLSVQGVLVPTDEANIKVLDGRSSSCG